MLFVNHPDSKSESRWITIRRSFCHGWAGQKTEMRTGETGENSKNKKARPSLWLAIHHRKLQRSCRPVASPDGSACSYFSPPLAQRVTCHWYVTNTSRGRPQGPLRPAYTSPGDYGRAAQSKQQVLLPTNWQRSPRHQVLAYCYVCTVSRQKRKP